MSSCFVCALIMNHGKLRKRKSELAFWSATIDLRTDKMNMSSIKKISHKTGKWQINRWCHHKSHKVNSLSEILLLK